MTQSGLQEIFEQQREPLLRYLRAHGAGDYAEDLLQELWLKLSATPTGPVSAPRNYLFRAATNLMIDWRRSQAKSQRRDLEWTALADHLPGSATGDPGPDRSMDGQRRLALVEKELAALPARAVRVFRLHRIDGHTQRQIAASLGLSSSTIESDLRLVYAMLGDLRRRFDEE